MNFRLLAASALLLGLSACAHPPAPYQPAQNDNGPGYTDQRLADNRYRVTFTGNSVTRRETVENYLLLRAAEVTRDAGFAAFVFDDRDTEAKTTYRTMFTGFSGWQPGFGFYRHSWIHDPWDPFWRNDSVEIPSTRYQAYAEIVLLTADQAKSEAHALNAADVIARLSPKPPLPAN